MTYFTALLKRTLSAFSEGRLFSGHPELLELDIERDFAEIDRCFNQEEWPFLRSDLEVSHAQPLATGFIARKNQQFAGFFSAHHFGDVGYLDMMIIDKAFQRRGITRPLYFKTLRTMKRKGIRSFVVHTTQDSARLIRFLGFRPSQNFTLLARDPIATFSNHLNSEQVDQSQSFVLLGLESLSDLISLDAKVFGKIRSEWIAALLAQPSTQFYGLKTNHQLSAAICLRPRKNNALCLDTANAFEFEALQRLLEWILEKYSHRRLECFVKTDSQLHALLVKHGFGVPEFFKAIGPLTEWRKGRTGDIGKSALVQCLSWF